MRILGSQFSLRGVAIALAATGLFSAASVSAAEIEIAKQDVRVHPVRITSSDSDQADALRDSAVRPWLADFNASDTSLADSISGESSVLRLPLSVDRFTRGSIEVSGASHTSVYLNGSRIASGKHSVDVNLQTGDHKLIILVEGVEDWSALTLNWQGKAEHDTVATQWPEHWRLSEQSMFDAPTVSSIDLSADGRYLVWRESAYSPTTGNSAQNELVIKDLSENRIVYRWQNANAGQFAWHPSASQVAYISGNKIEILDLTDLSVTTVTAEQRGMSGLRWLDDSRLVFNWTKTAESDSGLSKRFQALEDRWSSFRNVTQNTVNIDSGLVQQHTFGGSGHSLADTHRDGDRLLVSSRLVDYAAPPHFAVQLFEVDVASGETRDLGTHRTFNQAVYGEEGIYIVAGPEFADNAGRDPRLAEDLLTNNYDGQLYRLDANQQVTALSREFDPAISSVAVLGNQQLLLRVTERDGTQLYRFDPRTSRFMRVSTDIEVVSNVTYNQSALPKLVIAGSGATTPQKVVSLDLQEGRLQTLWDSADVAYTANRIAPVEEWNFTNRHGDEIHGRVYYPHNFDPEQTYPALVYYYGGTTPVQRGFTGRYPFNLWAHQGYVVYVLQPTGAIGYGQEFSARHVNAWGEYTAEDIIQGTQEFLAAHPFVDADRVGHLGASYGGFMTMLLATMTDIFSASMSHAGISNITSYWGHGWWGFLYSGEASKGSFPWNNADLYSQQSPVFHADKVTAPMLLIHGDADTNVPPGESHIMYTALKLLDKEVELVEYKGQDHHIIGRDARFHWWATYMAWFDKHLKDQPEWWDSLYPEKN
ncbi:MAG: prolyl oligopeptidase family serine peptidase [Aliidiomarina sp.]|uniref:S9 family peptidase n=1 Tax=Aliidiomarina sp. TaxID=1872439 RepID=UPI0025BD7625|nr:prolyl oligopeptidase family serine peptidase [Aliidiomarina sp.]MCH8500551.1 prolyl oligopeptidase family serine peptidase [Aliidiomarina sp.]